MSVPPELPVVLHLGIPHCQQLHLRKVAQHKWLLVNYISLTCSAFGEIVVCVCVCVCLSTMTNEQIAAAWTYIQSTSLHHCHHHCVFNFLYCLSTFSWIKPDSSRWLLPCVHFTANVSQGRMERDTILSSLKTDTHRYMLASLVFRSTRKPEQDSTGVQKRCRMKTYLWLSPFRRQQGQG